MKAVFVSVMLFAAPAVSAWGDYASTLLSYGPIAYWRFDETVSSPAPFKLANSGTVGTAGDAYAIVTVTNGVTGKVGNAIRLFNPKVGGSKATPHAETRADVFWNKGLNSPSFTVEFWVQPTAHAFDASSYDTTGSCPISNFNPNNYGGGRVGWHFYLVPTGMWNFRLGMTSGYAVNLHATNGTASAGTWQHIAATYDGSTVGLYANGVQIGAVVSSAAVTGWVPNTGSFLRFGATPLTGDEQPTTADGLFTPPFNQYENESTSGNRGFDGLLDEVAIYTNALPASTIAAHYDAATTNTAGYGVQILADNPAGYWNFDEPTVTPPSPPTITRLANAGSLGSAADGTNFWGAVTAQPGSGYSGFGGANKALALDGEMGYVAVNDAPGLHISNNITLMAWVKPAARDYNKDIIAHGWDPFGAETFLRITKGDGYGSGYYYEIGACDGESFNFYASAQAAIPDADLGNWVFLAGTFDGSSWNLYRNGVLAATLASTNGAVDVTNAWTIGARAPQAWIASGITAPLYFAGYNFAGSIDEPAIFANALSAADILALYSAAQVPPVLTIALQNPGTVAAGSNVNFSVWADGSPTLGFLWTSNGISTGVTASNYSISNIQPGTHTIAVVVINAYGTNSSSVTFNAINVSPSISAQPISTTRIAGYPFSFSVTASGTPPLTYYWKLGNNVVQTGAASSYTATASLANAGSYKVIVSNVTGINVTSTPAILTVNPIPGGYGGAVVASGPMAFWRLDETNGSIAHDQIGGNDGTYFNATLGQLPSYSPLDPNETAVAFSGVNSYVNISGTAINFTGHTNFTLEAWVKAPAGQFDESTIIAKGAGCGGTQFSLDVSNGVYRFFVANGLLSIKAAYATAGPNDTWQHLVAVYDDQNTLGGGSNMYIFLNGVQQGSGPVLTNGLSTATSPVSIGSKRTGCDPNYSATFNGRVSQVAIYAKALDAATVLNHNAAAYATNNTCLVPSLLTAITVTSTNVSLIVQGSAGCSYQMQTASALTGPWNNLGAAFTMPTNGRYNFSDTNALAVARFYRVTTFP
jgi:Concanavalin A-like lectin/glucanases superfamily